MKLSMNLLGGVIPFFILSCSSMSDLGQDTKSIKRAVTDYIQSQHQVSSDMMARGIDKSLAKRTYWISSEGKEIILESRYDDMVKLAGYYNKNGDKFPSEPKIEIEIYDIDRRVASVKLTADDWIDYMHVYKNSEGNWKVINVLWQFNDIQAHSSYRSL